MSRAQAARATSQRPIGMMSGSEKQVAVGTVRPRRASPAPQLKHTTRRASFPSATLFSPEEFATPTSSALPLRPQSLVRFANTQIKAKKIAQPRMYAQHTIEIFARLQKPSASWRTRQLHVTPLHLFQRVAFASEPTSKCASRTPRRKHGPAPTPAPALTFRPPMMTGAKDVCVRHQRIAPNTIGTQ